MRQYLVVFGILFALALGFLAAACGDESDFRHKDSITQDNGKINAKDWEGDEAPDCSIDDVVVEDCYDACSCCYFGQLDNMEQCVFQCGELLDRQYFENYEPTKADYERFTECTLGCVSLCGEREKSNVCFEECKIYLGM